MDFYKDYNRLKSRIFHGFKEGCGVIKKLVLCSVKGALVKYVSVGSANK